MATKVDVLHLDFFDHPIYSFVDDVNISEVLRTVRRVGTAKVSARGDFAYDEKGCLEGHFTIELVALPTYDAEDLDDLYNLIKRFIKSRVRTRVRVFEREE